MTAKGIGAIFSVVVACGGNAQWSEEQIEAMRHEIGNSSAETRVKRGRQLDPAIRQAIIEQLRLKANETEVPDSTRAYFSDFLFDLGDETTIINYAERYNAGDTSVAGSFPYCQNPRVIELIAPVMFHDEGWVTQGPHLAPSFSTAQLILQILATTPDFNSEVINWARRLPGQIKTFLDVRDVMREWWRANERFFKERNYKAVQPGRDIA